MTELPKLIESRRASVCIVGGGYVGLPLAADLGTAGFSVVILDQNPQKVDQLSQGRSYIDDVPDAALGPLVESGKLCATTDPAALESADIVVVCVPTPLNKSRDPDVSSLLIVAEQIKTRVRVGMLICVESTTYPGFTREAFLPIIQASGLVAGEDFYLAYSPERVDPGNETYNLSNTPRVVGGSTARCLEVGCCFYEQIVDDVVPLSSTDAAEMAKLLENTFRVVNIGLVNEVALMCQRLGLDTWEVIEAAGTKPYGYMTFFPGPGVGGHCIPVDPHYLSWKLRALKYYSRFIELAGEINSRMPQVVVELVARALNEDRKAVNGARVLIVGVAYKRNVSDFRESPALDVIELLASRGAEVAYIDPFVPEVPLDARMLRSLEMDYDFKKFDCAVVVTHHSGIDYERLVLDVPRIVDARNVTRGLVPEREDRILRL